MTAWRELRDDDRGIAMVTVVGAMFVMGLLTVVAVQFSRHSLDTTSTDRARSQGTAVAQAGLDATFQKLGSVVDTKTLPCGTQSGVTLTSGPTTSTYTVTITYYSTFPVSPATTPLTCPQIAAGSVPGSAEIKSVGSTNSAATGPNREMDAMVRLTSSGTGSAFDMAIFSDSSTALPNNGTVNQTQNGSNDANIYSNGDLSCANSYIDQGTIYSQGTFTVSNTCNVRGNVYVANGFTQSGNSQVGGDVTVSHGNLSIVNPANIAGYGYASGTCASVASITHGCIQNMSGLAPPKSESFPQLNYDATAWVSPWVIKNEGTNCNAVYNDVTNMSSATSPTVIYSACPGGLSWSGNTAMLLKQDLAIFSTTGFSMSNKKTWDSTDTTTHKLELIVPYNAGTRPCTSPGVTITNNSKGFSQYITLFLYSPCVTEVDNNANFYGQIYGGQVIENNHFTMNYRPIGAVPGAPVATAPAYLVGIQYEREVTP